MRNLLKNKADLPDDWMLDTGYWILVTGCWMLDTGCWILDAGYWY